MAFPLALPLIAGAASIGGAAINAASQNSANEKNIALAREQMAFQKDMSSTAWQRGMSDMKKAGMNPMLAFSQGGASSPAGSQARVESTRAGDGVASGVNSAVAAARELSSIDLQAAQVQQSAASSMQMLADARLKEHTARNVDQNTRNGNLEEAVIKMKVPQMLTSMKLTDAQKKKVLAETFNIGSTQDAVITESNLRRDRAIVDRDWVDYDAIQQRLKNTFDTAGSAVDIVKPFRSLKGVNGKKSSTLDSPKEMTERMRRMWLEYKRKSHETQE